MLGGVVAVREGALRCGAASQASGLRWRHGAVSLPAGLGACALTVAGGGAWGDVSGRCARVGGVGGACRMGHLMLVIVCCVIMTSSSLRPSRQGRRQRRGGVSDEGDRGAARASREGPGPSCTLCADRSSCSLGPHPVQAAVLLVRRGGGGGGGAGEGRSQ